MNIETYNEYFLRRRPTSRNASAEGLDYLRLRELPRIFLREEALSDRVRSLLLVIDW